MAICTQRPAASVCALGKPQLSSSGTAIPHHLYAHIDTHTSTHMKPIPHICFVNTCLYMFCQVSMSMHAINKTMTYNLNKRERERCDIPAAFLDG